MNCPACNREVEEGSIECPVCGIVFSKWRGRAPSVPRQQEDLPTGAAPVLPAGVNLLRVLGLAIAGAVLVLGGYWYLELRPRNLGLEGDLPGSEIARSRSVRLVLEEGSDFDRRGKLQIEPRGAASNGLEILLANRKVPGGFLRLTPAGDSKFGVESITVIESTFGQKVSFRAVTWNGSQYVGYTDRSWFEDSDEQVFTLHERGTLAVEGLRSAPPALGCLAWDGASYWAGTRKNTRETTEVAWLYRLSPDFEVVDRFNPPGVGCQGLAWDGSRLWWADTFDDRLTVLDVSGPEPVVVREYPLRGDHPSGLAWDGSALWMSDFGERTISRLNPRLRAAWSSAGAPRDPDDLFSVIGGGMEAVLQQLGTEEFGEILARLSQGEGEITADEAARLEAGMQRLFGQGPAGEPEPGEGLGELAVAGEADLEGVWEGSLSGEKGLWTVIITGETFFVQGPRPDAWMKGKLQLDVEKDLPVLDIKVTACDCPYRRKRVRALYRLAGGWLTMASGEPGTRRPKSLEPSDRIRVLRMSRLSPR